MTDETAAETKMIVSKAKYAEMKRRGPSAISNWIAEGRITPAAIVGSGVRAKIWVEQADRDIAQRLDTGQQDAQRHPIGSNGSVASVAGPGVAPTQIARPVQSDPMADEIRKARLEQLRHMNQKLAEEAALRSGRYMLTEGAMRQFGRIGSELMQSFDGMLQQIYQAIAAEFSLQLKFVQLAGNKRYLQLRAALAASLREEAKKYPPLIEDDATIAASEIQEGDAPEESEQEDED